MVPEGEFFRKVNVVKAVNMCCFGAVLVTMPLVAMQHDDGLKSARALAKREREIGLNVVRRPPIDALVKYIPLPSGVVLKEVWDRATVIVKQEETNMVSARLLGEGKRAFTLILSSEVPCRLLAASSDPLAQKALVSQISRTSDLNDMFIRLAASYFFYIKQQRERGFGVFDCLIPRKGTLSHGGNSQYWCRLKPCEWRHGVKPVLEPVLMQLVQED